MIEEICQKAKAASVEMAKLSADAKNTALCRMANALEANVDKILAANKADVEAAKAKGLKTALLDRLALDQKKIQTMAKDLREVSALADPIGTIISTWTRPNGLIISQVRVPLGVVGIIYESRPDVTSDAAGICIKSGNAVILRGGSDALNSNVAIGEVLRDALAGTNVPVDAVQVVNSPERNVAEELMGMRQYIDVLIPRGGADLIKTVVEKSRIPVIETGTGNCHVYVEEDADLEKATPIVINAKCQRPGTCNAAEKLLVHRKIAERYLPVVIAELRKQGVEVRGDEETRKIVPDVKAATEQDWYTEYLDLIMGVKVVKDLDRSDSAHQQVRHQTLRQHPHSGLRQSHAIHKRSGFSRGLLERFHTVHRRQPVRLRRRNRHKHTKVSCERTHERATPNNDKVRYLGRRTNPKINSVHTLRRPSIYIVQKVTSACLC